MQWLGSETKHDRRDAFFVGVSQCFTSFLVSSSGGFIIYQSGAFCSENMFVCNMETESERGQIHGSQI